MSSITAKKRTKQAAPATSLTGRLHIEDHVIALAWSPDGQTLAAAAVSGPITLFEVATGKVRHTLSGHGFGTSALAWDANGGGFASAGQDGKIRLWDTETGQEKAALAAGAAWVERIVWSPTGSFLASAAGKKLKLWYKDGQLLREYPDHASTISDLAWKPGSRELAAAAYGGLYFWNADSVEQLHHYEWKGSTLVIAWSPDGKYVATGDQDSTVHFWITQTGKDLQMWGYPTKVKELAWDATSRFLATGGGPDVTVWDCSGKGPANTKPMQLKLHQELVSVLAFQHRGNSLASGGLDGRVGIWQPAVSKKLLGQAQFESGISQIAWSPDDKSLAVGCESGAVEVFMTP